MKSQQLKSWIIIALAGLVSHVAQAQATVHQWTSKTGRTISAEYVKGDATTVTIFTNGRNYVVKLASLQPESQALARKLTASAAMHDSVKPAPPRQQADVVTRPKDTGEDERGPGGQTSKETPASAKAQLSYMMSHKNGKQVRSAKCRVKIKLRGADAQSAYAIGPATAEPITVDGQVIELERDRFGPSKFSLVDRSKEGFFAQHPKDGIGFTVKYGVLPDDPTSIECVKGSVMVLTGGKERVVSLPNVLKHPDGPINDPILSAAGLALTLEKHTFGNDVQLDIVMKKGSLGFAGYRLTDPAGKVIKPSSSGSCRQGDIVVTNINKTKALLQGATLHILVRQGFRKVSLPFKVENVPIK